MARTESVPSLAEKKSGLAGLWPVLLGLGLVIGFFLAHQFSSTGFFTPGFGGVGTILFYTALFSGLVPVVLGTLRLNRRTELVYLLLTALFWTGAAAWFFFVFPFDFSHLTAVVPSQLSFLLGWITNDIGRILLGVSLIGAAAFIPFYLLQLNGLSHRISDASHSEFGQLTCFVRPERAFSGVAHPSNGSKLASL